MVGTEPPYPAPTGTEWHFESPVGVDCSTPEPRCIWLAVLRCVATPTPAGSSCHGIPKRAQHPCPQHRAKGQRDGISASNANTRTAGEGVAWQGPRTVVVRKNSQGFGFTLRHFIVYPPESALHTSFKDEENGNGKEYQRGRLEPMDTIFVKSVRERGPAHQAGLCTGDRLVKVNGESVLGKTYSQVIALIQNSESMLELCIMPKDEDVLQLILPQAFEAYSQDAYLRGNEPYTGGAHHLPDPPPISYLHSKPQQPHAPLGSVGQNWLDNWSRWPASGPTTPLDNRPSMGSPANWQEGRGGDPRGVGHSSPAHRTEEIQYGMTGQQATGQARGRPIPSSSSGGVLTNPLHFHYPNHNAAISPGQQAPPLAWASPPQPRLSRSEQCQQALTDWYYSQVPEHPGPTMHPRHRSYSQDRLGEAGAGLGHHRVGWPHSASQDTLLLQPGPTLHSDPFWAGLPSSRARSENLLATKYDHFGRSLEMLHRATALVSPHLGRPAWLQQAPPITESYQRPRNHYGAAAAPPAGWHPHGQPPPPPQRLPPPQTTDDPQMGYRSYSPSFYRKTGRFLQAQSFRDPSFSGPHLSWMPSPKASPPDSVTSMALVPCSSSPPTTMPEHQDGARRLTNHERVEQEQTGAGQEVVLRQKPPTGRRASHLHCHPQCTLLVDTLEPPDPAAMSLRDPARRPNGALALLPLEDDSLATIPFIGTGAEEIAADEPTSPNADLHARHVPASSVVSSAMNSAPAVSTSPAFPTSTFPLTRLFSHDCSSIKSSRRSSYLLAITTERSKSCDEGLNTFREEGRVFSRLPKRVKSFFTDGSLESLGAAEEVRTKRHSTSELGNITISDVRKDGWLHYKQIITEKGKKVGSGMRPWKRVFSVLRSHSLFLYKDKREAVLHGAAMMGGGVVAGHVEDEQPISIRGCLVDIAYSETKRKHALRLTTQDFCEYLLQAEDREGMLGWIKAIRENSKADSEELGISGQALINKKLNDYRKQSPTGNKPDSSPKVPRMKPPFLLTKMDNAAGLPGSPKPDSKEESGPPKATWGINIMKKAKKSGPKVFGVRLEDCQPAVNNKFIPLIVEICCGLVEEMGLEYTGIYRVPGNNAMVSSLQEQLNKGVEINPTEEKWQDLNVVSSLLKSFFRKLPEPLFTDDKYNDFIDANRMENAGDRLKTMKKLIHDLPVYYYHTLKFLVGHLKTVADHADKNKMEPRNLALVFGPTLVRTSEDNMTDMVTHMPDRYKIIETLIQHYDWFFSEELDKDEKTPVYKADLQPIPNIDHLLSNIGRTAMLGEASDSTNSDSAKSKGSWGSKRDLNTKDFLALSIMSAVTRKRKKQNNTRPPGSSTDEDSEHEPIKTSNLGEVEEAGGDTAPRAEGEEDEEEEEEEEEADRTVEETEIPSRPCKEGGEEDGGTELLPQGGAEVHARVWRGTEDERSIVSGYSTLSTLGRSLASEGRGDDADDERSELTTPTDTGPRGEERGRARSTTPSSSSSSSTTHRLHGRPSFNSHKLIQCDTLARRKLKGEKAKARSLDLELELGSTAEDERPDGVPIEGLQGQLVPYRARSSPTTSRESLHPAPALPLVPAPSTGEAVSFSPGGVGHSSFVEQVRARLLGSADDLRAVGLRKPLSPETRRRRRAWRRHTVVNLGGQGNAPLDMPNKRHSLTETSVPPNALSGTKPTGAPRTHNPGLSGSPGPDLTTPSARPTPTSRFHQYL
ncbi:hypothetical protein AAFF_G00112140 [Aldrovandia affinis]|uniref:Rho GTPase-activating protein 23-like n=1 Tax=Aldrovandia affinis TaxID=143900 RepID=A0AAD7RT70_9TELE|nr:hypothetical protein AAFF_G00112140 [Aldrovandia affinis]